MRSIAMVESKDGIHWTYPQVCISPDPSCSWMEEVNRQIVIEKDNRYYMWFNGQKLGDLGKANGLSYICHATSDDGIHWEIYRKPVMEPVEASWEGRSLMCPHVIWDDEQQVFRLWYSAGEYYEPNAIGYATSVDGIHWDRYRDNPIFKAIYDNYWERQRVGACTVLKKDGWHYMTYIGYEDIHKATICMARSKDGINNWQRHKENPIATPGYAGEWDCESIYKATMAYDEVNDRWLLWFNAGTRGIEFIGLLTLKGNDFGFDK